VCCVQVCPEGIDSKEASPCPRDDSSISGNFVAFGCSGPDEYNELATLFFNTQDDAIRNLFSTGTSHEYSKSALLVFFLAFYGFTIITYGIPVPAGVQDRPMTWYLTVFKHHAPTASLFAVGDYP
jgi:chloride channel 7